MFWAERQGLANVHERVRRFHEIHGEIWAPAPLLESAAANGGRWASPARAAA
jgi:3-hydroxyacyl-CoA dehydrogenase